MTEQEALIALNMVTDIGSVRLKRLLEAFGSAPRIFLNSPERLMRVEGIGARIAASISGFSFEELKKELELSARLKVKIVTLNEPEYPENLKDIYGAPLCLYLRGSFKACDKSALAIVGSRRASVYGLTTAFKFSSCLADLGITIVSGLARGVDTQAHKGALKAKGRTIAVLGSGINCVYPPENKELAEEIAEGGVLVSEFPLNTRPLSVNFPRRNRVISGLSLATMVVEAAKNSGALITADFALEQGREVFAVPGKVDSATSSGTNQLIKQGAKLVDSLEDILEEPAWQLKELKRALRAEKEAEKSARVGRNSRLPGGLSREESLVYERLSDRPSYADDITENTGLSGAAVLAALLGLELKRLVKQLPGKMFVRG